MSHRVAVMYLGRIVELGSKRQVYDSPRHPYTKALLSAQPAVEFSGERRSQRILLKGEVPSPANPPSGCRFRTRCWKMQERCAGEPPPLTEGGQAGHRAACYFPET
jgi:peptide/nickel transport system ATP-binding protein/oligopeptide transport system ATP-binding protein